jgi:signal transduction histidine kinase
MVQKHSSADKSRFHILIVDDEDQIQKLLKRTLSSQGFQTRVASNGKEALTYLKKKSFDIVISDIAMPEISGIELTKKILSAYSADVILMTGMISQYHYDEIIGIGASDFIQKPFTNEEIILRTNRVIRERCLKEEQIHIHNQLAQAQKLESIGQLSAGIAHEINTPIQYISDNTFFLKDVIADLNLLVEKFLHSFKTAKTGSIDAVILEQIQAALDEADLEYIQKEIPQAIDQTIEGIDRIKNIIQAMKVFSHPGQKEHVPTDLNQCLQNAITISKNEWKDIAELSVDFDPTLPQVACNPGEMNQVFLNLLVNAGHAISQKAASQTANKDKIKISTNSTQHGVEIKISDTGTGIPEAIKTQIFDPFFTTKDRGKGTGQGLAISRSIVEERHQGKIEMKTREGEGTTFIILLPLGKR